MITIKFSRAKANGSVTVSPTGERRIINEPLELKLKEEIQGQLSEKSDFIFNGVESFAVTKISPALVLDILQAIPKIYCNSFRMLDPDFTSELQSDFFKEARDLAVEIAEDHGTGLVEKAAEIRRRMVTTRDELVSLAERLKSEPELAIDLETFPTIPDFKKKDIGDTRKSDVRLLSISTANGESTLVDLVELQQDLEPLRTILETKRIIGHNLQFEYGFLLDKYGIELKGELFDTLLAARVLSNESPMKVYPKTYLDIVAKFRDELLDPPDDLMEAWEEAEEASAKGRKKLVAFEGDRERVSNSLDMVLLRFLEIQPGPDMSTSDWKREQLTDRQLVYAVEDTKHLFKLRDAILADADDGDKRIIQLDLDTQAVCLSLYKEGLPVNRKRLEEALIKRTAALEEAHKAAAAVLPGTDFESPVDCVKALGALGIYVESIEKTELAQYADNPVISSLIRVRALIAEVRDLDTKFRAHLRSDDRLHGVYNPGGATSGRLSAKSPNLQNVRRPPSKIDLASDPDITNFRDLVEAPEGWQIIVADYNQMELRAAAVFTEEPNMLKVYREGSGDLHKETAARLSESDFEQMTDEEKGEARQKAKAANFGLVYGQQAKGFRNYAANSYGVDLDYEGAVEMRNKFFNLYPRLAVWHELAMEYSWTFPEYEETLYGRKRWLHPWSKEVRQNWAAFQNLTNHIIQGSCADAFKLALVGIHKSLDPCEARLIGNVHDEILVLARDHAVGDTKKIIRNVMQTAASVVFGNAINFTAELKSGKSWACK